MASKGSIGTWEITQTGIKNNDGSAYIIARDTNIDGTAEAIIGTNVFPATSGVVGVAYFENSKNNPYGTNYGAVFNVTGANINIAAEYTGYIKVNTGFIVDGDKVPIDGEFEYERNDNSYKFTVKHGLIIKQEQIG